MEKGTAVEFPFPDGGYIMPEIITDTFNYDNLLAGGDLTVLEIGTIDETGEVKRGTVLGRVSSTNTYKICKDANADGSNIPVAILAEDLAASASNKDKYVYLSGNFNKSAVIFDAGVANKNKAKIELHSNSIFLR